MLKQVDRALCRFRLKIRRSIVWRLTLCCGALRRRTRQALLAALCACAAVGVPARAYAAEPDGAAAEAAAPLHEAVPAETADSVFHIPDISAESGRAAPLPMILPPFRPTDYLLLSFRGLPRDFSLSSGFRTTDAWLVSAHEAEGLEIIPPADYAGGFMLEVRLIRGQHSVARTNIVQVRFAPAAKAQPAHIAPGLHAGASPDEELTALASQVGTAARESPAVPLRHGQTPPLAPDAEKLLLEIAETMLARNDVGAARGVLRGLAYRGSARGAFRLAESYDAALLSQLRVAGRLDDPEQAVRWYEMAAALGSVEAAARLAAHGGG